MPNALDYDDLYGRENLESCVKLATIACEIDEASTLISDLSNKYGVVVSMGHSDATFE